MKALRLRQLYASALRQGRKTGSAAAGRKLGRPQKAMVCPTPHGPQALGNCGFGGLMLTAEDGGSRGGHGFLR